MDGGHRRPGCPGAAIRPPGASRGVAWRGPEFGQELTGAGDGAVLADAFGAAEPCPGPGSDVDEDGRGFSHHCVQGRHEGGDFSG